MSADLMYLVCGAYSCLLLPRFGVRLLDKLELVALCFITEKFSSPIVSLKGFIVFDKNHRRRKFFYELLNLHTRIHINKVKWLIPYVQMRLLTEAFRYQNFFF